MENQEKTRSSRYLLIFIGVIFVFLAGFYTARIDVFKPLTDKVSTSGITGNLIKDRNGVDVNLLWEVWAKLEEEYIDPEKVNGQDLLYGAANGLVEGLGDKYTTFLSPEETEEYLSGNKREFQGIGTTLAEESDLVVIESPIDGSPAQRAGLKAKDVILKVDDIDTQGKSAVEVARLIRGDANTVVSITYYRPAVNETKEIKITREKIDLDNMEVKDLGQGIFLFKVYQFTEEDVATFNREWDRNVSKILEANPKGVIVDLRNNPGGFVDAVRYAAGEFLPQDKVVFQEETRSGKRTLYKVNRDGRLLDIPMVVIVNEGSASSSEIFSGAMQDNKRAQIVGTKTVGKGVEQKLIELSDGSMLQVVFQKWLTADGRNITQEEPITPDHLVEDPQEQEQKAIELLN